MVLDRRSIAGGQLGYQTYMYVVDEKLSRQRRALRQLQDPRAFHGFIRPPT